MTRGARPNVLEPGDAVSRGATSAAQPPGRVELLARLTLLRERRLYGQGVAVAVVDDGIYRDALRAKLQAAPLMDHGACPIYDVEHSRVPNGRVPGGRVLSSVEPFSRTRRTHGSMCAYDACLGAPGCTLLDLPVLAPRPAGGRRLHYVLVAYRRLVELLQAGTFRHIVVINAWQTLPGDEHNGVPTDDPAHPLYRALSELDAAGADVLFAAPDHHAKRIHGPALHPRVLTVTAVNLDGTPFESSVERVRLDVPSKPDVSNYQGFAGYELFRNQGDYGTSAATALTAGLIAAVRSAPRARTKSPAELRELFRQSATQREVAERPERVPTRAVSAVAAVAARAREPGIVDVGYVLNHL